MDHYYLASLAHNCTHIFTRLAIINSPHWSIPQFASFLRDLATGPDVVKFVKLISDSDMQHLTKRTCIMDLAEVLISLVLLMVAFSYNHNHVFVRFVIVTLSNCYFC